MEKRVAFFVPEKAPKKAKKSKKLTIDEKDAPKKPPYILRKSTFYAGLQESRHQIHALLFGGAIVMHIALHGERNVRMPDDLRQGTDILSALHPKRGERVAQGVDTAALEPCLPRASG